MFFDILCVIKELFPEDNQLSSSMYEAKKTLSSLGIEYEKIHACSGDCILYKSEYKDEETCLACNESRWNVVGNTNGKKRPLPIKILRYFPPIPRFQWMYDTKQIAKDFTWHAHKWEVNGYLHHSADSPSRKLVDNGLIS